MQLSRCGVGPKSLCFYQTPRGCWNFATRGGSVIDLSQTTCPSWGFGNPTPRSANPLFCVQPAHPDHPFSVCAQYLWPVSAHSLWSVSMKAAWKASVNVVPPQDPQRAASAADLSRPHFPGTPGLLVPYFLNILLIEDALGKAEGGHYTHCEVHFGAITESILNQAWWCNL